MPRKTKENTVTVHKSAKSGKMVSEEFAAANPDTTFEQVVEKPKKVKAVDVYMPCLGEIARFVKGNKMFLAEIQQESPLELVKHDISEGCHRTQLLDVFSLDGYIITPLTKAEVYENLY